MKTQEKVRSRDYQAVVIGTSAGGMKALQTIFKSLPGDFSLSIIVVQHVHPDSDDYMINILNQESALEIKQADEKEPIRPGTVYFAPPNYHLLVETDKTLSLTVNERVCYARPSIDVLFETASDAYANKLIGIILTGGNFDGSRGLKKIKESGGLTIVQDPMTAEAASMPQEAIASTKVDHILPLNEIGPFLVEITKDSKKNRS
ncbi:MAG: chemotaxis protein CheB [Candidatus Aminicenantes bacterium]|nr:chemotaxis protein CheB [Candidatus Aminicenantes bacterium]